MKKQIIPFLWCTIIILLSILGIFGSKSLFIIIMNSIILLFSIILFIAIYKEYLKVSKEKALELLEKESIESLKTVSKELITAIDKQLKQIFKEYFDCDERPRIHELDITDLNFTVENGVIIMDITLCKPGLLIGPYGKTIDDFTNYIKRLSDSDVKIQINESTFLL